MRGYAVIDLRVFNGPWSNLFEFCWILLPMNNILVHDNACQGAFFFLVHVMILMRMIKQNNL